MALSYSIMIVVEALVLVPSFSYLLLSQKKTSTITLNRRTLIFVALILFSGSAILFLLPKINLVNNYEQAKLTTDAWDHYLVTRTWSFTGVIPTDLYSYYSNFPLTYVPQIVLNQVTGLSLFDAMTIYYFVVGVTGLLIIYGIAGEIIRGPKSERIVYAAISGIVYSFLQYFNLLFVQQYPLAVGTVAGLFCIYAFALLARKKSRALICLSIASIILAISHPFAPIFVSILFFVYYLVNKAVVVRPNPYVGLVSRRIAVFVSLAAIIAGMTYSVFVATSTFEHGVRWSELDAQYTFEKISSDLFQSATSGVGKSFEGRYQAMDTTVYALNWALPTSTSISMLIFLLIRRLRNESDSNHLLLPLAIMSTFLFILSFAFSFVEFAFSRYFGAFALAFNIPLTSYLIFRIVKIRLVLIRYAVLAVFGLAIISSVTDPTMLPQIRIGDTVFRNVPIYPAQLDIVAWDDFHASSKDQSRLIQTNLNAGPIRHYKELYHYQNEIVVNPKNYTSFNHGSYLIIDKTRLDPSLELNANPMIDRVYDNSRIYFTN